MTQNDKKQFSTLKHHMIRYGKTQLLILRHLWLYGEQTERQLRITLHKKTSLHRELNVLIAKNMIEKVSGRCIQNQRHVNMYQLSTKGYLFSNEMWRKDAIDESTIRLTKNKPISVHQMDAMARKWETTGDNIEIIKSNFVEEEHSKLDQLFRDWEGQDPHNALHKINELKRK